ncbi:MAG: phosphate acyltransferase PlsX [Bacteroidetes bacterium]|nr:phosphate acyltransferase PlsX [Rhodothermia bacterium]MCS7155852.1 phosphate acyltransferase PlsX [Bacteroidota bacterium]MCX7906047.1 phosphate acyltransferase PlsX [Bacteroidota bacterium]MDW8138175.1 phosphate acyltransferase PlsX [Bacteroidota bacterium]MDW8285859.1 phosphate acyltransferase PlsX [Bacteroidota bacterium]
MRIALDAMGGDHAPHVTVAGAIEALQRAPGRITEVLLVGPGGLLEAELKRLGGRELPLRIVDAPEVIGMAESPAVAVKAKPRSSIVVGLGLHARGEADAFVSAGHTGAVMAAALFVLGRLEGVSRPSIGTYLPGPEGFSFMLDVGANVDCRPEHLVQFAHMGRIFVQHVLGRPDPRVALLNIGEEPSKGDERSKQAYARLAQDPSLRFIGNVEGRDLLLNRADVVVCDGFVGNVVLKFGESFATVLDRLLQARLKELSLEARALEVLGSAIAELRTLFDYEHYGGVPLLGVNGIVIIGHGRSTAKAISQMLSRAEEMGRLQVNRHIAQAMQAIGAS